MIAILIGVVAVVVFSLGLLFDRWAVRRWARRECTRWLDERSGRP